MVTTVGSAGADSLYGYDGYEYFGLAGDDVFYGQAGAVTVMMGGSGSDAYVLTGGYGSTTIIIDSSGEYDAVFVEDMSLYGANSYVWTVEGDHLLGVDFSLDQAVIICDYISSTIEYFVFEEGVFAFDDLVAMAMASGGITDVTWEDIGFPGDDMEAYIDSLYVEEAGYAGAALQDSVFYFYYYDAQGDAYWGYAFDDGTYGYTVGDAFAVTDEQGGTGWYVVYDAYALGYDSAYTGYVGITDYYDADSGQWAYVWGYGWGGIGSEFGYIFSSDWATYDWFAYGFYEADLRPSGDSIYYFVFADAQGDAYYGSVYDDGTFGYYEGYVQYVTDDQGGVGYYYIYDSYALGYDSPYTGLTSVTDYYDADGGLWGHAYGYGMGGLGSEVGIAWDGYGHIDWYGFGIYEADLI